MSGSVVAALALQVAAVTGSFLSREQETSRAVAALPEVYKARLSSQSSHHGLATSLKDVKSHVDELEARLAEVQIESASDVAKQRNKYESVLAAGEEENRALKRQNEQISSKIRDLRESNRRLRKKGEKFDSRNQELREELKRARRNITSAVEFSDLELNTSVEQVFKAPEVEVLNELVQKDQVDKEALARKSRLHEIEASRNHLAMLELGVAVSPAESGSDAQALIESLASAFGDLQEEQAKSQASLKAVYEKQMQVITEQRAALLQEQAELNVTLTAEEDMENRLNIAYEHLKETHRQLTQKVYGLQNFFESFARNEKPSSQQTKATPLKLVAKPVLARAASNVKPSATIQDKVTGHQTNMKATSSKMTKKVHATAKEPTKVPKVQLESKELAKAKAVEAKAEAKQPTKVAKAQVQTKAKDPAKTAAEELAKKTNEYDFGRKESLLAVRREFETAVVPPQREELQAQVAETPTTPPKAADKGYSSWLSWLR